MMLHSPSFRTSHKDNAWGVVPPIIDPLGELAWRDYQSTDAKALYGQASAPIYENMHLTLGFRYAIERRAINGEENFDFSPASGIPSFVVLTDAHKFPHREAR